MTDPWALPEGRVLEETKTSIRTLPRASAKTLERARRTWPEARPDDFEREGKLIRDKRSGVLYRRVPGDPTMGRAGAEDVSVFFVSFDEARESPRLPTRTLGTCRLRAGAGGDGPHRGTAAACAGRTG